MAEAYLHVGTGLPTTGNPAITLRPTHVQKGGTQRHVRGHRERIAASLYLVVIPQARVSTDKSSGVFGSVRRCKRSSDSHGLPRLHSAR
jgi:hypothetical protein